MSPEDVGTNAGDDEGEVLHGTVAELGVDALGDHRAAGEFDRLGGRGVAVGSGTNRLAK
jgi:hypothetical protein